MSLEKCDNIHGKIARALNHAPENSPFVYPSLLILIDAVDCIAKIWGRIVKDHLDISYQET